MKPEKRKFKCEGCGKDRPCFVEINQEPSSLTFIEEDLKCILDETNQTSYEWVEIPFETVSEQMYEDGVAGSVGASKANAWDGEGGQCLGT